MIYNSYKGGGGIKCTMWVGFCPLNSYRKDTEPIYHYFMYSLGSLLSGIYLLPAMHSCYGIITVERISSYKLVNTRVLVNQTQPALLS